MAETSFVSERRKEQHMKCRKCKADLRKGIKFCPICGAKVKCTSRNILLAALMIVLLVGCAGIYIFQTDDTVQAMKHYLAIDKQVAQIADHYVDESGCVEADKRDALLAAVHECAATLYEDGKITDYAYQEGDTGVYMQIDGWLGYFYEASISDTLSGNTTDKISITTMEPYAYEFGTKIGYLLNGLNGPDDAAEKIVHTFNDKFVFTGNYDNHDVDIDTVTAAFRKNSIIMWNGHGGYSEKFGPILGLGTFTENSDANGPSYSLWSQIASCRHLFQDDSLMITNSQHICVTPIFFELHISDGALDGSLVYLNACNSFTDSRLAQSLWDLGARCIVGNSTTIWTPYGIGMMCEFFEGLTNISNTGAYRTVSQALDYAKEKKGERDPMQGGSVVMAFQDDFTLQEMNTVNWINDALPVYLKACRKTTAAGSWTEAMTMTADATAASGGVDAKFRMTADVVTDIDGWKDGDLSGLRLSGSANATVAGQRYAWNMTYENGRAHYDYTEPSVTSAELDIAPGYFNFSAITEDMVSKSRMTQNKLRLIIRGDAMTQAGLAAASLLEGVSELQYGDVTLDAEINQDTGALDTLKLSFHASMIYQGMQAEADYSVSYQFTVREASHEGDETGVGMLEESVWLEDLPVLDSDRYTGNEGDSFLAKIGTRNGTKDTRGSDYTHGLEAWIARWNNQDESSWAWCAYDLGGKYQILSGTVGILDGSYNKSDFDTTLEIWGDGELLYSLALSPDMENAAVHLSVEGVKVLKISLYDNKSVSGGTSFALGNFRLHGPAEAVSVEESGGVTTPTHLSETFYAESYEAILGQYPASVYPDAKYTLYDVDKDGIPELIVRCGGNNYDVYSFNGTESLYCGLLSAYDRGLYEYDGNGLVVHDGGMGSLHLEYAFLYTLSNGTLEMSQTLKNTEENTSEELRAYLDGCTPIGSFYPMDDPSHLQPS